VKVTKKQPLTLDRFDELFALVASRADSPRSWTVTRAEMEARGYDLKAVNPTAKAAGDTRTPMELLDEIEARGREVDAAVARLRALLGDEARCRSNASLTATVNGSKRPSGPFRP